MNKFKDIYHYFFAYLRKIIHSDPSKKIKVIGVTGTKGKTSVVELIALALSSCGYKVAIISSLHIVIAGQKEINYGNTMPGKGKIQEILAKAVKAGCSFAVVEVSSQGIVQHRHKFIDWDGLVFLNLHPEHIEAHGGFENYKNAKISFFTDAVNYTKSQKAFFINKEDKYAEYFIRAAENNDKIFFGGEFLKANYEAALAVATYFKCDKQIVERALIDFSGIPGRLEIIIQEPFKVIVDYAHTPDSLEQLYKWALLPLKIARNKSKLICVLGSAGGGRDKWKRPKMGEVASRYCNEIIITNEDPYDEDPMDIINAIAKGAENCGAKVIKILDRQEAIDKAIAIADHGDIVALTGKGSEQFIHLAKGKKIIWSDKRAAKQAVKDRHKI